MAKRATENLEISLPEALEGLWSLKIEGNHALGGGVLIFTAGQVLGGGDSYIYEGSYRLNGPQVLVDIEISPLFEGAYVPLLGYLRTAKFQLNVWFEDGLLHGEAHRRENRNTAMPVTLARRKLLPAAKTTANQPVQEVELREHEETPR